MTTDAPPAGPRTVYTGRTTNWPMVALTSALAALLIVMGWNGEDSGAELAVPMVLIGLGIVANVLTASSVRAAAGPNGFDVRWGLVGWPRCTYRIDEIATAEVVHVPWTRVTYGLWWTPKRTSCTLRAGDAVRLVLTSGRIVTVTVPDPALAVQAVREAQHA